MMGGGDAILIPQQEKTKDLYAAYKAMDTK
jgi:hypothetical protein